MKLICKLLELRPQPRSSHTQRDRTLLYLLPPRCWQFEMAFSDLWASKEMILSIQDSLTLAIVITDWFQRISTMGSNNIYFPRIHLHAHIARP
jgi:hypothetical protein